MAQNTPNDYPKNVNVQPVENGFIVTESPDHSMGTHGRQWAFTNAMELGQFMERYYGRCVVTTIDGIPYADKEKTVEMIIAKPPEGAHIPELWAKHFIGVDPAKPMGGYRVVPDEKEGVKIQGLEATDIWYDEAEAISEKYDDALDAAALVVHKFKGAK